MRVLSLYVVAICATAGFAQTIADDVAAIPSCGINCLYPAIAAAGCGQTDWDCICGPGRATVKANSFTCVVSSCSGSDALSTYPLTHPTMVYVLILAKKHNSFRKMSAP